MNKKYILICDSEVEIRESLKLILKDGYDLTTCNNGKECLSLLEQKFDLLLLTIRQGGLDIIKTIKKKTPDLKVIIVTDYKNVGIATETIKSGAVDYIVKPFSSKEILNKVAKYL